MACGDPIKAERFFGDDDDDDGDDYFPPIKSEPPEGDGTPGLGRKLNYFVSSDEEYVWTAKVPKRKREGAAVSLSDDKDALPAKRQKSITSKDKKPVKNSWLDW